jgi:hypothetical protein
VELGRQLVPSEPLGQERAQVVELAVFPGDDERDDDLSERRVGLSHDRRIDHVRVLGDHVLDLSRIDVLATADDQLLAAAGDREIAIRVCAAQVRRLTAAVTTSL